jgi:hypothetical protein
VTTPPDSAAAKQRLAGVFDRAADSYESTGVPYFDVFGPASWSSRACAPATSCWTPGAGAGR